MLEFLRKYVVSESPVEEEESPSYVVDGNTYIWKRFNDNGCYYCEIPKNEQGSCKCPRHPCGNLGGYYIKIK